VPVFQFDPEHGIGKGFYHGSFHLDMFFFCHKKLYFPKLADGALYPESETGKNPVITDAARAASCAAPATG
jgi:hypothetical protein